LKYNRHEQHRRNDRNRTCQNYASAITLRAEELEPRSQSQHRKPFMSTAPGVYAFFNKGSQGIHREKQRVYRRGKLIVEFCRPAVYPQAGGFCCYLQQDSGYLSKSYNVSS
jgi:hypothetical protein